MAGVERQAAARVARVEARAGEVEAGGAALRCTTNLS